ncbi:MAG: restriction endonuclease [Alphaproteobacteria bacterium]|nr:MAG: restriction endonuclease [Alphaproteobacteria bacterium]
MPIRPIHIVEALSELGGQAHLDLIVARVVEIVPDHEAVDPAASVRARLQENSSDSHRFNGRHDLFASVYGLDAKAGVWRLRSDPLSPGDPDSVLDEAEADIEAREGRAVLRMHLRRERSRALIDAFKKKLETFTCEACGTDMEAIYGSLGKGYIEAHHRRPVSQIKAGETTKLSDLAALCPDCHRMIHRNGLMSVEGLAMHLKARAQRYPMAAEPAAAWVDDKAED